MYVVPSSSSASRNSRAPSVVAGRLPHTPSSRSTRSKPVRFATRPTYSARLMRSVVAPIRARICEALRLETRGLYPLARQENVDGLAVNAQDTPDADGGDAAVMKQVPERSR